MVVRSRSRAAVLASDARRLGHGPDQRGRAAMLHVKHDARLRRQCLDTSDVDQPLAELIEVEPAGFGGDREQ